ncbi:hypothetical protein ACHAW6_014171 [Cyclotella cf. meneghiniana]
MTLWEMKYKETSLHTGSGNEPEALSMTSVSATQTPILLEHAFKEKVRKYEQACLAQCQDFTPLVYSANSIISKKAWKAECRHVSLLATNMIQISLAIIRSNTLLLQSDRTHPPRLQAPDDGVEAEWHDLLCNE